MRRILTIALGAFKESVRERVLYNLIVFAFLMIGAAILLGSISVGVEQTHSGQPGPGSHFRIRPADCHFYRDRIGLKGDRSPDDLQYPLQASHPGRIHPGKICRVAADTFCQHGHYDRGFLPCVGHSRKRAWRCRICPFWSPCTSSCSNWPWSWGWRFSFPASPRRSFPPFSPFASLLSATFPAIFAGSAKSSGSPFWKRSLPPSTTFCPISAISMSSIRSATE